MHVFHHSYYSELKLKLKLKPPKTFTFLEIKQAGNYIKLNIINVLFHLISKATFVMFLGLLINYCG